MNQPTTQEEQDAVLAHEAATNRARSLDASNVNLESGTGKVPVKTTSTPAEREHVKALTGQDVIVGPLAEQDPLSAQVALVADARKAVDETRAALPADHDTPETAKTPPRAGLQKGS